MEESIPQDFHRCVQDAIHAPRALVHAGRGREEANSETELDARDCEGHADRASDGDAVEDERLAMV